MYDVTLIYGYGAVASPKFGCFNSFNGNHKKILQKYSSTEEEALVSLVHTQWVLLVLKLFSGIYLVSMKLSDENSLACGYETTKNSGYIEV